MMIILDKDLCFCIVLEYFFENTSKIKNLVLLGQIQQFYFHLYLILLSYCCSMFARWLVLPLVF